MIVVAGDDEEEEGEYRLTRSVRLSLIEHSISATALKGSLTRPCGQAGPTSNDSQGKQP
jgi:hypothetical protein